MIQYCRNIINGGLQEIIENTGTEENIVVIGDWLIVFVSVEGINEVSADHHQ